MSALLLERHLPVESYEQAMRALGASVSSPPEGAIIGALAKVGYTAVATSGGLNVTSYSPGVAVVPEYQRVVDALLPLLR